MPVAGDAVIDFILPDLDGDPRDSSDARSGGLLLFAFWKRTCGTCQYTFPFLQRFHDRYAGSEFQIWGIAQENRADALVFAAQYGATFPQLLDENLEVTEQYRLQVVPAIYLANSSGEILRHVAAFDTGELNAMARIVAEHIGIDCVPIVTADDNAPDMKPG